MSKAATACASARVLLEYGDTDGAVNRCYYAMFDAARAALLASKAPVESDIARTHSGLIGAFGRHLVKNGLLDKELGRLLNRAHEARLLADYAGCSFDLSDARLMAEQTERFIAAIGSMILWDT